jgi:hypothetical protein
MPDTYETDGAGSLKLIFEDIGEIDFICCADITPEPSQISELRGRTIRQETPAEIVAKMSVVRTFGTTRGVGLRSAGLVWV